MHAYTQCNVTVFKDQGLDNNRRINRIPLIKLQNIYLIVLASEETLHFLYEEHLLIQTKWWKK